jgi:hypothetical protein
MAQVNLWLIECRIRWVPSNGYGPDAPIVRNPHA